MKAYLPEALIFMFVASVVLLVIYFYGYLRKVREVKNKLKIKALLPKEVYGFCVGCNHSGVNDCSSCLKYFRKNLDRISGISEKGDGVFEV